MNIVLVMYLIDRSPDMLHSSLIDERIMFLNTYVCTRML